MAVIRLTDIPAGISPRGPKVKKVVESEHLALNAVCLDPGQVLPVHCTPVDVVFYVHKGYGTATIGEESVPIQTGDIILSRKNTAHGFKAGDKGLTVLVFKTPNPATLR